MNLYSVTCIYYKAQTQFIKEYYIYIILHENTSLSEKNYSYTCLWASFCFYHSFSITSILFPSLPLAESHSDIFCFSQHATNITGI